MHSILHAACYTSSYDTHTSQSGACNSAVRNEDEIDWVLTNLLAMGVLSSPGRCCSSARTTQFAVMVARIMYSNGVWATKLRKAQDWWESTVLLK